VLFQVNLLILYPTTEIIRSMGKSSQNRQIKLRRGNILSPSLEEFDTNTPLFNAPLSPREIITPDCALQTNITNSQSKQIRFLFKALRFLQPAPQNFHLLQTLTMPFITGIAHINLTVPPGTLEHAASFYAGTLGLLRAPVPALQKDTLAWYISSPAPPFLVSSN
jgi:hypothetical protein